MTQRPSALEAFLDKHQAAVVAELDQVMGSSPREAGTAMLIAAEATSGTIGGGQLEYMAVERARRMLRNAETEAAMDVPLGPEIGQCCGGRVTVTLRRVDAQMRAALLARALREAEVEPHVFVFGAGHVGKALARALLPLPVRTHVVDTRPGELEGLPSEVEALATALPESVVRSAPSGSAFVILTHDHALDFLLAAEALKRSDAPYVGMVGSRTKRARFASWYRSTGGGEAALARLVLPIGASGIGDKRPAVIAALAAAEIIVHIGRREAHLRAAARQTRGRR